MSLFKKFMHILTDLIVFVVLLLPIYQDKFSSEEAAGRFIVHFFGASILICVILCFIALICKFLVYLYEWYTNKYQKVTFPKSKENVVINTANKLS